MILVQRRDNRSFQHTVVVVESTVPLAAAVEQFRREEGAYSNSYDWYRRSALGSGSVYIGGVSIPAWKQGGAWVVDEAQLEQALGAHRAAVERCHANTRDYEDRRLHGAVGDQVHTDWGSYFVAVGFHRTSYRYEHPPAGPGTWWCSACWRPAETDRSGEECHVCSDWGHCRNDCTLVRVFCTACGGSLPSGEADDPPARGPQSLAGDSATPRREPR